MHTNLSIGRRLHDRIEQAILTGILKPRQKLTERELAKLFRTSRTPVREALLRLDALGLVDLSKRGGAIIRDFTPKQIADLYFVRAALETLAAPLVVAHTSHDDILHLKRINARFKRACNDYDLQQMTRLNHEFHRVLYAISGNEFLSELIADARVMSYVVRTTGWLNPDIVAKSVLDHDAMIAALESRDSASLAVVIKEHIVKPGTFYLATTGAGTAAAMSSFEGLTLNR